MLLQKMSCHAWSRIKFTRDEFRDPADSRRCNEKQNETVHDDEEVSVAGDTTSLAPLEAANMIV